LLTWLVILAAVLWVVVAAIAVANHGHLSRQALHTAHTILERRRQDAAACGRTGSLIEILVLAALADSAVGRRDQALGVLQQALVLAEPEGYARIFLDEGAPMHTLLAENRSQLAHHGRSLTSEGVCRLRTYIDGLLAAIPQDGFSAAPQAANSHPPDPLVEPLSDRELDVLRLIAGGASNQAIATALVISIGTVKSHINHILGKLAACNRTEAVARARELGLLAI